jgi:hypothetical protein
MLCMWLSKIILTLLVYVVLTKFKEVYKRGLYSPLFTMPTKTLLTTGLFPLAFSGIHHSVFVIVRAAQKTDLRVF